MLSETSFGMVAARQPVSSIFHPANCPIDFLKLFLFFINLVRVKVRVAVRGYRVGVEFGLSHLPKMTSSHSVSLVDGNKSAHASAPPPLPGYSHISKNSFLQKLCFFIGKIFTFLKKYFINTETLNI